MKSLTVDLGARSYPITIGSGLISQKKLFEPAIEGQQVLVVTNETVGPLYLDRLRNTLASSQTVDVIELPDGEQFKHLDTLKLIYNKLLENRHHRSTTLVALGGGVVGDMAGFAAATYQRGVNCIQVPTTLLSQVDSSVGGKTGVNHELGKNMIGAFFQPRAVIIDIDTLSTLPSREFSAGLAEVIKYGLIRDSQFFDWLEQNISSLLTRQEEALIHAIETSCRIKAEIVAADETEKGQRALLNLGHTFGHAIEAYQGYAEWLHGEAVACGMLIAAQLSKQLGDITDNQFQRIHSLLEKAQLPTRIPENMKTEDFFDKMQVDKKVVDGTIRYILLEEIGTATINETVTKNQVETALNQSY